MFTEINKAEPCKLIDLPAAAVSPLVKVPRRSPTRRTAAAPHGAAAA